jgi:hypothetical protein
VPVAGVPETGGFPRPPEREIVAMLDRVDGNEATENLRRALVDFRAVLEDLLQGQRTAA